VNTARIGCAALALAVAAPGQEPHPVADYATTIGPLVRRACAQCHRPGQPAPFALANHADLARRRAKIADVVRERTMPPWPITHGDFADARALADGERDALLAWLDAGAPRGDGPELPPLPAGDGWQLGAPDLVVRAPEALPVPAAGDDVVRNLVLPVGVDRLRFVAAVEIRPGNRAVHHAVLAVDGGRASRQRDAEDPGVGFGGMAMGGAAPPDGHFLGWTPGKTTRRAPKGDAWRLRPGDDLVLQLHLVPTGKDERVQPEIGLWFTDEPTTRSFALVALFSEAIDIAPGVTDFTLRDVVTLPAPTTLHALYPHAHRVCRRMRATFQRPGDATAATLFAIDRWDFDWQDDYRLAPPLPLPAGTRIAFEYVYDNSEQNPSLTTRPPARVVFGQRSADEMGTLTLSLAVVDADRRALDLAMVENDLAKVPRAWNLWVKKARHLRERGDFAGARTALMRAVDVSPGAADIPFELGLVHEQEGKPQEAQRCYEATLQLDPAHGLAHLQLGALLGRAGKGDEARRHFEQAVAALPNAASAHHNLATANLQLGRLAEARMHYERAVALQPDHFGAWINLGRTLAALGEREPARAALQRAQQLRPGDAAVQRELDALGR